MSISIRIIAVIALLVVLADLKAQESSKAEESSEAQESQIEDTSQPRGNAQPPSDSAPIQTPRQTPTSPQARTNPFASTDAQNRRLQSRRRLTRAPYMFGDFLVFGQSKVDVGAASVKAPLAFSGGGFKVADNNIANTANRTYFMFNHFHNALDVTRSPPGPNQHTTTSSAVNRYTIGIERTLNNSLCSIELRMPFTGDIDIRSQDDFVTDAGRVGNLGIILKRMIHRGDTCQVAAGMGISTPTAQDLTANMPATNSMFTINNQSVHLLPFLGILAAPTSDLFFHAFLQVDVPTNGNRVDVVSGNNTYSAILTPQTWLLFDVAGGVWLYRNPNAPYLTGLALLTEFHYSTTVQDADRINGPASVGSPFFGNLAGRQDIPNFTFGLDAEIGQRVNLRVGGVFPGQRGDNRAADSEAQVQVILR